MVGMSARGAGLLACACILLVWCAGHAEASWTSESKPESVHSGGGGGGGRQLRAATDFVASVGNWVHVRGTRDHPVVAPSINNNTGTIEAMIQYGKLATTGQFPYLSALFYQGYSYCTGTLIHSRVVLTAAHCLRQSNGNAIEPSIIRVGLINTRATAKGAVAGLKRGWKKLVVHQGYNGVANDVGLIFLDAPISSVRPVKLAAAGYEAPAYRMLTVAGFGNQDGDAANYDLRLGVLSQVPNADCKQLASYLGPFPLPDSLLCAGYSPMGTDVCSGDSGGPLVQWDQRAAAHVQVGLTHAGLPCASAKYPIGLYAKVSAVRSWIDATIAEHLTS